MRRTLIGAGTAAVAALAFAVAGCGDGGAGESDTPAYDVPRVADRDLHRCRDIEHRTRLRCGEIEVPFERADPSLGTTKVAFAMRARDERDRPSLGTIFAVEGGPGYASTGTHRAFRKLFGSLLRRRELVMVDMRGTGNSDALDCPGLQRGTAPEWIALPNCISDLGPRFGSYRTSAAADDINDVRRALGFERITLYGDSYGTFLSQSYAFRHPETLDALVLDSAYPARGESAWYPSLIATGVKSMVIACRRSPACSGDARARLAKLVRWLRDGDRGVGPLVNVLAEAGYGPPGSYLRIDRAGTALRHGNPLPWKRLIAQTKLGHGEVDHYSAMDEEVVSCNDYPLLWDKDASPRERIADLHRRVRTYRNDALKPFSPADVGLSSDTLYQYCITAPRPSPFYEPPIAPGDRPTRAPVLVISGELDNVTTPPEGKRVAAEFPNSTYYVARGAGHVADLYAPVHSAPAIELRRFLHRVLGGSD